MTSQSHDSSLAGLDPILGRWQTSGTVVDDGGAVVAHITGTDTYRLLPGGAWIAHDVDVTIGENRTVAHELIGGEHPGGGWEMHAFDSAPHPGVMRLSQHDADTLLLEGDGIRSWFHHRAGPHHMTTNWERLVDGQWLPWMDMRFDRLDQVID